MTAPFDLNDDSVIVVIGTGAGGGRKWWMRRVTSCAAAGLTWPAKEAAASSAAAQKVLKNDVMRSPPRMSRTARPGPLRYCLQCKLIASLRVKRASPALIQIRPVPGRAC